MNTTLYTTECEMLANVSVLKKMLKINDVYEVGGIGADLHVASSVHDVATRTDAMHCTELAIR